MDTYETNRAMEEFARAIVPRDDADDDDDEDAEIVVEPRTRVRQYVAGLKARMEPLEARVLEPLMVQLRNARVEPPVDAPDVAAAMVALKAVDSLTHKQYVETPNFIPRVLLALNGPDYELVPGVIVDIAEGYERDVAALRRDGLGWGMLDPPVHAVATRLLVAAGLSPAVLPDEPVLEPRCRVALMAAWEKAASYLQCAMWHPEKDVRAYVRRHKQTA
jgi:hypothetical protein